MSLKEVIGVTEFMISWVKTRVSRIHDSISLSSSSAVDIIDRDDADVFLLERHLGDTDERCTVPRSLIKEI